MSVESLAVVLHHSQASGTDKLVLVGIANHDGDGGAWPSLGTLGKYANVSVRSVRRSLENLRALGEVTVFIQAGGTRATADHKRPNRYEILVNCPDGCDRSRNHRVKPVDNGLFDPRTLASPPDAGVPPTPDAGVPPTPDAGVPRTILLNPPANPSLESTSWGKSETCRSCGQPNDSHSSRYCNHCQNDGLATELINCRHCATVARRQFHGQMWFYCPAHRHLKENDS